MSQTLNQYQLDSIIGEGGMGVVWKATDTRLGRPVAIKLLHENLARDQQLRERFSQEARMMAMMSHHNIVTLYDYIEQGDTLALVMEYVDGRGLDKMIGKEVGPIVTERALPLFNQVLDAFEYAHGQGIIHRDIKPSNILVTRQNVIKVTDLGIAKIIGDDRVHTRTGTRMGTLYYMSPEQVRGEKVTVQSDIYALGITLFEMVSGRIPFNADTSDYEIMDAIIKKSLPDPREFYPDIPDYVVKVINKATNKETRKRFQFCGEMKIALNAPLADSSQSIPSFQNSNAQSSLSAHPTQVAPSDFHGSQRETISNQFEQLDTYCVNPTVFSGKGRWNRKKFFWWYVLFDCVYIVIDLITKGLVGNDAAIIVEHIVSVGFFLPTTVAIYFKRLHDLDKSGHWLWLWVVTFGLFGFYMLFAKGTEGPNRFGPDPLAKGKV